MAETSFRDGFNLDTLLVLLCYKRSAPQKGQRESCRIRKPAISLRSVAMERGLCRPHESGTTAWAEVLRECGSG